jgi:hypothetical protein
MAVFDLKTHSSRREDPIKTSGLLKLKTEVVSVSDIFKENP